MKLNVMCTSSGLVPLYDEDYEQKRKLKVGKEYEVTIKERRNPKFHRLYFALINCSWEFLNEARRSFFKEDVEIFRKTVEIAAGHYELVYSIGRKEWVQVPKSIAFDKLNESDFHNLYERCKDVIYNIFIPEVNKEEFEQKLMWF